MNVGGKNSIAKLNVKMLNDAYIKTTWKKTHFVLKLRNRKWSARSAVVSLSGGSSSSQHINTMGRHVCHGWAENTLPTHYLNLGWISWWWKRRNSSSRWILSWTSSRRSLSSTVCSSVKSGSWTGASPRSHLGEEGLFSSHITLTVHRISLLAHLPCR